MVQLNARSRNLQAFMASLRVAVSLYCSPRHNTKIWRGSVNQAFHDVTNYLVFTPVVRRANYSF
jgi:hypothetical protein